MDSKFWHSRPDRMLVDLEKDLIALNNGYKIKRVEVNSVAEVLKVLKSFDVQSALNDSRK